MDPGNNTQVHTFGEFEQLVQTEESKSHVSILHRRARYSHLNEQFVLSIVKFIVKLFLLQYKRYSNVIIWPTPGGCWIYSKPLVIK